MVGRLAAGLLLVGACGGDDGGGSPVDSSPPAPRDLEAEATALVAPGPHAVGHRSVTVTWSDPLLTEGAPRELVTYVWYPTDDTDGAPSEYLTGVGSITEPADDVFADASLAPGPHPVAVFSHGHQAHGAVAAYLSTHLASHGWVVVAPYHEGTLPLQDRVTETYAQRPLDLSAVLDWLDAPTGDPLEGQLRPERVGLGHSFGGYTLHALGGASYDPVTIAGCDDGTAFCSTMTPALADRFAQGFSDPRVSLLVSMAPGDYRLFGAGMADISVPVMLLSGGFDGATDDIVQGMVPALDHPGDRYLHLPTLGHNGFTTYAGVLDPSGVAPAEDGWGTVQGLVLAALREHVDGFDASPFLDGTVAVGAAPVEYR